MLPYLCVVLAIVGCGKREELAVSEEVAVSHLALDNLCDVLYQGTDLNYWSDMYFLDLGETLEGVPRVLVTLWNPRDGGDWNGYYLKNGQLQQYPIRFLDSYYVDPNNRDAACNYVDADLDNFYILMEEGQKPKLIFIHVWKRFVGYDKTKSGYAMCQVAKHITIDAEGYLNKMPISELIFLDVGIEMEEWQVREGEEPFPEDPFPRIKLKPNAKLERVHAKEFFPSDPKTIETIESVIAMREARSIEASKPREEDPEVNIVGSVAWIRKNVTEDTTVVSETTHVVQEGEDIYSVAIKTGVPPPVLRKFNNLDRNELQAGQVLKIPVYAKE